MLIFYMIFHKCAHYLFFKRTLLSIPSNLRDFHASIKEVIICTLCYHRPFFKRNVNQTVIPMSSLWWLDGVWTCLVACHNSPRQKAWRLGPLLWLPCNHWKPQLSFLLLLLVLLYGKVWCVAAIFCVIAVAPPNLRRGVYICLEC